ncbi:MAG: amino acid carrier protein [Oscillospiraceae bacterium]
MNFSKAIENVLVAIKNLLITIENTLVAVDNVLWGNWLLVVLLGVGVLYTVISGGVQIRHFKYAVEQTILKPIKNRKNKQGPGAQGISSFQAFCTALASCVGGGNIVGVSTAVLSGGLGAIFWMWVAAFVGMATKYGEIVLGLMYRDKTKTGEYIGGPFYYMEKGLKMKWLAKLCSVFMVVQIIGGNFIQSNIISGVMKENFSVPTVITGIALVLLIGAITLGGLKRLAGASQKIVPYMAGIYVVGGLIIILINYKNIPAVFSDIFTQAFSLKAVGGGAAGTVMSMAMKKGIARGLYSNEAGEGSAPVVHAPAQVDHPVEQAITGVMEVFLDTFVICTITGLLLGVTGVIGTGMPASVIAIEAFATVWNPLRYVIICCLLMFCTTSLMVQWYFGFVGLHYACGYDIADKFKYVFPLFCIIGATLKIDMVWTIQDIALACLTIPNLFALILLYPKVQKSTKEFFSREENKHL